MSAASAPSIRPDELDTTRDVIVDARLRRTDYVIASALRCNVTACLADAPSALPREGRIAVYSDSAQLARAVVQHLHRYGYAGAAVLKGGFEDWCALGMPLEPNEESL